MIKIKFKAAVLFALAAVCALLFSVNSQSAEITYNIGLAQKTDGIAKLEYLIDGRSYGSTAGTQSKTVTLGSKINFLVQTESTGYAKLHAKNVKIKSDKGTSLGLNVYVYDKNNNLITRPVESDELINPAQTYVSDTVIANQSENFEIAGVTPDTFKVSVNPQEGSDAANEALSVVYQNTDGNDKNAVYSKETNSLNINEIPYNTALKLKINPTEAYSKSEIKILNNGSYLTNADSKGYFTLPGMTSDINLSVQNVQRNTYSLMFENSSDASFKYKKQDSENNFENVPAGSLIVKHGESYLFTCEPSSEFSLEGKELTVNSVASCPSKGIYSISNISEDKTIKIIGKNDSLYPVGFAADESRLKIIDVSGNVLNNTAVKYDSDFNFKISPSDAYTHNIDFAQIYAVPQSKIANENLGAEEKSAYLLTPSFEDVFTISKIKEPIALVAENLEINKYKVTLPQSLNGAEISVENSENITALSENKYSVLHGSSMKITVTAKEDYDISGINVISDNPSAKIVKNENVYSLENITSDTDIIINNIKKASSEQKTEEQAPAPAAFSLRSASLTSESPDDIGGAKEIPEDNESLKKWRLANHIKLVSDPSESAELYFTDSSSNPLVDSSGNYVDTIDMPCYMDESKGTINERMTGEIYSYFRLIPKSPYLLKDLKYLKEIETMYYLFPCYKDKELTQKLPDETDTTITDYIPCMRIPTLSQGKSIVIEYSYYYRKHAENRTLSPPTKADCLKEGGGGFDETTEIGALYDTVYVAPKLQMEPVETCTLHIPIETEGGTFYQETTRTEIPWAAYMRDEIVRPTFLLNNKDNDPNNNFKFVFIPKEGYELTGISLKPGRATLTPYSPQKPGEYGYTVTSPYSEDIYIVPENLKKKTFDVNFSGDGTKFLDSEGSQFLDKTFEYGEKFSFTTQAKDGYVDDNMIFEIIDGATAYPLDLPTESGETSEKSTPSVNVKAENNNSKITYTLSGIKGAFKVRAKRVKQRYKISFVDNAGITYCNRNGDEMASTTGDGIDVDVNYGRNYSFTIKADDGYDISNMKVIANSDEIPFINGRYTIKEISSDVRVYVQDVKMFKQKVTFIPRDGLTFKDSSGIKTLEEETPDYNTSVSFKAVLSDAYAASDFKIIAEYSSGTKISSDGNNPNLTFDSVTGIYTLKNIQNNVRIYAEGIQLKSYEIKLAKTPGINYYNQYGTEKLESEQESNDYIYRKASYGENFSFKIVPDEGFELSNLKVHAKSDELGSAKSQLLPADNVFTIENIRAGYVVTADSFSKINYKVEFRIVEGGTCLNSAGQPLGKTVNVAHGDSLSFSLSLDGAYNKSNPSVTIKGTDNTVPKNPDGTYTLSDITENKIVEVINITKNTYKATFKSAEGVIYKTQKNKPFEDSQNVEYGSTFYFKISLMDAYDQSAPWVQVNGEKTLVENGGVYSLENIRDDIEITVKNVVKNPEEVTMDDINNVPEEILTDEDVTAVVKATQTYMNLSDENKEKVTSTAKLEKAQTGCQQLTHTSNGVTVSGMDWNIKLMVTPLSNDAEQMEAFSKKVDKKTLLSLYKIHLLNLLTNEVYEVPYGQKVSVTIPSPDLRNYMNGVVVHEKNSGSIEYLSMNKSGDTIQFETSSFSLFGVAAKEIPNYAESTSDLAISVASLVENDDELKSLLGEGLISQLGDLTEDSGSDSSSGTSDGSSSSGTSKTGTDSTSTSNFQDDISKITNLINGESLNKAYTWAVDNEFVSMILILTVGSALIWLIIFISKKQNKNNSKGEN